MDRDPDYDDGLYRQRLPLQSHGLPGIGVLEPRVIVGGQREGLVTVVLPLPVTTVNNKKPSGPRRVVTSESMGGQPTTPRYRPGEGFQPNSDAQYDFYTSAAPEVCWSSAYGKGKSRGLCEYGDYIAREWPGANIVLARKTRESMGPTTLHTLLNEVITPQHKEWGWKVAADGGSTLNYPNGSKIIAIGLDKPARLRSGAFILALVDQAEELELEEIEAIRGRLRQVNPAWRKYDADIGAWVTPIQQLKLVCNPDSPAHWIYRQFNPDLGSHKIYSDVDEPLPNGMTVPAGTLKYECIVSGTVDNYENLPPSYLLRLQRMSGTYKDRYVDGKWVSFSGQVYDIYDSALHLIDKPLAWEIWGWYPPPDWPRYRSIDFGFVNPFVCQWWARNPEGQYFRYRELYMSRRIVADHSMTIRTAEALEGDVIYQCWLEQQAEAHNSDVVPWDPRDHQDEAPHLSYYMSTADHDAEDRATLDRAGIITTKANKEVEAGIKTVYEMLKPMSIVINQNEEDHELYEYRHYALVYLVKGALIETDSFLRSEQKPTCTEEEFPAYRRHKPREGVNMREDPVKEGDHGMDTMRMLFHTIVSQGAQKVESVE
jgi:phage terminase large subunit